MNGPDNKTSALRNLRRGPGKRKGFAPDLYRHGKLVKVDGRSKEGMVLTATRNALSEQLGRKPTPAERMLIERLSWLNLRITYLDTKILLGTVNYHDAAQYNAHLNSFSRGLTNLGLLSGGKGKQNATTIFDIIKRRAEA
jgi:hypothetical protein